MSTPLVLSASAGAGTTLVTLNRPEKRNALSVELVQALLAALTAAESDPAQRVLLLTGAGPVFCAGLDLAEAADPARAHLSAELIGQALRRLSESRLVTIAVVRGAAIAGGAGLMSACDFAFAEATAQIGYPETRRGLVAALVMTFLRRQLRERDARRLLLTGELVTARHAEAIGLINAALGGDELMPAAEKVAAEVRLGGPEAVARTKQLLAQLWPSPLAADLDRAMALHLEVRQSAEIQEGIAAFREKRPPRWLPGARPGK
ncbi:MAG TPA: enoyl-CoA hydratase/isomerase family protein [Lacunisphaera sp.]|jgi:methylglutaconyl-CoA hydratase|nr:enoyl-CoA hydratase/isomerase family protein [Lacunisphaera sp.]HQY06264.1 enoyl-CoA hydratase/isomerase family protein [Lacunisphaera sp.]